jgi:hypothetical protein
LGSRANRELQNPMHATISRNGVIGIIFIL